MDSEQVAPPLRVVVYSSDRDVRELVHTSLMLSDPRPAGVGHRGLRHGGGGDPGDGRRRCRAGHPRRRSPAGRNGDCPAIEGRSFRCPPILILTGRPQDAWLATWSRADAVVPRPISPFDLAAAVVQLLNASRDSHSVTA